jgi:CMP-N-acetylneuraminic acid synthetase
LTEIICIIPARSGSKRLPYKNKKLLCGEPIICRPIRAAQESRLFSEIIVSSDDAEILHIAHEAGAHAIERPAKLATDTASEIDAYLHVLGELKTKPEYFCAIYPTAAFITPHEIRGAFDLLNGTEADVCMGVTEYEQHPWQALLMGTDGFMYQQTPTLNEQTPYPPAYASNGSLYWFRTAAFLKHQTYFPPCLSVYPTFNIDINTHEDFKRAERICRRL